MYEVATVFSAGTSESIKDRLFKSTDHRTHGFESGCEQKWGGGVNGGRRSVRALRLCAES